MKQTVVVPLTSYMVYDVLQRMLLVLLLYYHCVFCRYRCGCDYGWRTRWVARPSRNRLRWTTSRNNCGSRTIIYPHPGGASQVRLGRLPCRLFNKEPCVSQIRLSASPPTDHTVTLCGQPSLTNRRTMWSKVCAPDVCICVYFKLSNSDVNMFWCPIE